MTDDQRPWNHGEHYAWFYRRIFADMMFGSNMRSRRLSWVGVAFLLSIPGTAWPRTPQSRVDRIVVYKHSRLMVLFSGARELKTYRVALGTVPVGPKQREGDHRTPEGTYVLDWRNDHSQYYKAFHISYPAPQDVQRAQKKGVRPGGAIMLHGTPAEFAAPAGYTGSNDWTDGCIAVTNSEMDEILTIVDVGTKIEIYP